MPAPPLPGPSKRDSLCCHQSAAAPCRGLRQGGGVRRGGGGRAARGGGGGGGGGGAGLRGGGRLRGRPAGAAVAGRGPRPGWRSGLPGRPAGNAGGWEVTSSGERHASGSVERVMTTQPRWMVPNNHVSDRILAVFEDIWSGTGFRLQRCARCRRTSPDRPHASQVCLNSICLPSIRKSALRHCHSGPRYSFHTNVRDDIGGGSVS